MARLVGAPVQEEARHAAARLYGYYAGLPDTGTHWHYAPGAGAAHRLDHQPFVLEQRVQNAPGEGAVRAAALERQVERRQPRRSPRLS